MSSPARSPHMRSRALLLTLVVVASPLRAAAQEDATAPAPALAAPIEYRTYTIPRLTQPVQIDGQLREAAWESALEIDLPWEIQPSERAPAPAETRCLLAYDDTAFLLGCHALDPEPGAVRAHLSDRDAAFGDDWIGVIIDTFHDGRRGYELFVNPLGVQMDLSRNEAGGGEDEDASWDAIWESAGSLTEDGYVIEMAVPFASLSFQHTEGEQTWGITVLRNYPRSVRRVLADTPFDRDRNCTLCQMNQVTGFAGAEPGRNLEIAPTVTASRTDSREASGPLETGDVEPEAGLTVSWGVTPSLRLGTTINPDFSQVEADSPQLDVNERFALFFPEKRPFFLEAADFFDTFFDVVHTRNIADPEWGVKLTGKQGRHVIGAFAARDSVTNLLLPGAEASALTSLETETTDAVLRYRLDIGESSTVGALLTSRSGDDYESQTGGLDLLWRWSEHDRLQLQALGSRTAYPQSVATAFGQPPGSFTDEAWQISYTHGTDEWYVNVDHQNVGAGFRADLGFMPQVDFRNTELEGGHTWWGEDDDVYTRIDAFAVWALVEDQRGELLQRRQLVGGSFQGPLQSFGEYFAERRDETLRGERFENMLQHDIYFELQPTGDLELGIEVDWGDAIDIANVRPAEERILEPFVTWRPGRHLRLSAFHAHQVLDVDAGRLFRAQVSQLTSVYQFSVRTFARLIAQRRAVDREVDLFLEEVPRESEELFGQLLFSYTINPQTVLFLGYSERRTEDPVEGLEPSDRAFFLKIGYAWVI